LNFSLGPGDVITITWLLPVVTSYQKSSNLKAAGHF